jgi:ribonuclease HII
MDYMDKSSYIVGIDEAGRGPVAGPVAVGIFVIRNNSVLRPKNKKLKLKDSKKLSERQRNEWWNEINEWKKLGKVDFCVMQGSAREIDEKGIAVVIRVLIEKGLKQLKIPEDSWLYLDGSLRAPERYTTQKTIIKGDEKIRVISLASICAKVFRDQHMKKISKKYPAYGFWKHKGYGTIEHMKSIKKHGLSKEHRKTFLKGVFHTKIDKAK